MPNITAIIDRGHSDRKGSASITTNKMTTIADDVPDPRVINKAATSTPLTDLNRLEVLPPREILTGSMMIVIMDANPAIEALMLNCMRVQHGKRQAS